MTVKFGLEHCETEEIVGTAVGARYPAGVGVVVGARYIYKVGVAEGVTPGRSVGIGVRVGRVIPQHRGVEETITYPWEIH